MVASAGAGKEFYPLAGSTLAPAAAVEEAETTVVENGESADVDKPQELKPWKVFHPEGPPLTRFGELRALCVLSLIAFGVQYIMLLSVWIWYQILTRGDVHTALLLETLILIGMCIPLPKCDGKDKTCKGWAMTDMVKYLDMECVCEEQLEPDRRQYMMAQYPHGTWPIAALLSAHFVPDVLPGQGMFCLVADMLLWTPWMRLFVSKIGAVSAHDRSVAKAVAQGASCSVVVGGMQEMFLVNNETEVCRIRRGFARECLKYGLSPCPVFHFGNSRLFHLHRVPGHSLLERWTRASRLPAIIYTGPWYLPIPRRQKIIMVIGRPIHVEKVPNPTHEDVERLVSTFKTELRRVYDTYRPEWETRQLVFVEH